MTPLILVKGKTLETRKFRNEFGDKSNSSWASEDLSKCFCGGELLTMEEEIILLNSSISSTLNSLKSSVVNISAGMIKGYFVGTKVSQCVKYNTQVTPKLGINKYQIAW